MNEKYTDITIILDKSGSMGPIRMDTLGGLNTFIKGQQQFKDDKVLLTLIQFSNVSSIRLDRVDINYIKEFTVEDYVPGGSTALLDAVGEAIDRAGKRFAKLNESERPGKILFVIITDGEENSSCQYSLDQIKKMITHQQDVYKWQFVFLGANQDAFQSAASFGILTRNTSNYYNTSKGINDVFLALNSNTRIYREASAEKVQTSSFFQTPIEGVDNMQNSGTSAKP